MSIQEISLNFKRFLTNHDTQIAVIVVIVSVISFFLGRMSIAENTSKTAALIRSDDNPLLQEQPETTLIDDKTVNNELGTVVVDTASVTANAGSYVASKSGKKYHLPWCSGAKSIKEENKIWFKTKEAAEAAGYTPAANCKGI